MSLLDRVHLDRVDNPPVIEQYFSGDSPVYWVRCFGDEAVDAGPGMWPGYNQEMRRKRLKDL